MAVQRRVFRIEEAGRPRATPGTPGGEAQHREFMNELQALREMMTPRTEMDRDALERVRAQIAEASAYKHELGLIHAAVERTRGDIEKFGEAAQNGEGLGRAGRELAAIAGGTERATQSILQATEEIDQAAHLLTASLKGTHERGLAHDIQERVVQIFEACNFHDLTGQRVSHVMETLTFIEEHVARLMAIWHRVEQFVPVAAGEETDGERRFLNGPRLPDDPGHSNQDDIDTMFGCPPDLSVNPAA